MARSAQDICFWVNSFGWTYDPRETVSTIPFDLFPRQAEFLEWVAERERLQEDGIAEKCRDVGFTWLCCSYQLHGWLFRDGFKGAFGSRKLELVDKIGDPDCIFEKLRILLRNLPAWMLPAGFKWSEHDNFCKLLNPANGSSITGEGGDNIGRGGRASVYMVDEAAYLEHAEKVDAALSQTSRVKLFVSTPNGNGNPFARKRHSGKYPVFTFRWRDDPRKNDAWYAEQVEKYSAVVVAQEVDIDYTASVEGITIPGAWVQAAVGLELPASGPLIAGLDVAAGGKNLNVLIGRQGPVVHEPISWGDLNTTQSSHRAADEVERMGAETLFYDSVGVGAGVEATFESSERVLRFIPDAVNAGSPPTETEWPDGSRSSERFLNLRAELWWLMRARFERSYEYVTKGIPHPPDTMISLPNHPTLIHQLSQPLSVPMESGKIKLESKADMKKRGIESPDFADALALTFAPGLPTWGAS